MQPHENNLTHVHVYVTEQLYTCIINDNTLELHGHGHVCTICTLYEYLWYMLVFL